MKNFIDRKEEGMPKKNCLIEIIVKEFNGERKHICQWFPCKNKTEVGKGYIGTARVIKGLQIGFNVWEQNDSEFRYYRILN